MPRGTPDLGPPRTGGKGGPSSLEAGGTRSATSSTACSASARAAAPTGEFLDPDRKAAKGAEGSAVQPGTASMRASTMGRMRGGAMTEAPRASHMAATLTSPQSSSAFPS